MEELYKAIEDKIKEVGYTRAVSGQDIYEDICEQIEDKENGSYILLSKFFDDVLFEYVVTIHLFHYILTNLHLIQKSQIEQIFYSFQDLNQLLDFVYLYPLLLVEVMIL